MKDNQQIIRDTDRYQLLCEFLRWFAARPYVIENNNDAVNDNYEGGFKDGETHLARMILAVYEGERF